MSKDGIGVDPTKIETVKRWPQPKDAKPLHSFLRLCDYLDFSPKIMLQS